MPQSILFVDDEQFVHKALKRSFRKMRSEWDMYYANSPQEALKTLKTVPMDVIITETVFPGQNGMDFLKEVRERHPHSVRIILSGYTDQNIIMKSVDLAHQYLAKPCEDETLKTTIARAFMVKELLDQDALKHIVSRIETLPSLPALYVELVEALKSEDTPFEKIGDIIAKDIGITAKILKLVNSSFFGLRQQISNPAKAVSLLGLDLIKAFVLTSGTFDKFKDLKIPGFPLEQMWQHAMITAANCKIIAQQAQLKRKDVDNAFMAGLLHDIGKLLIAAYLPESFSDILELARQQSTSMAIAEMEVIGTTHAAVGAYLLGLWGLPDPIINATAYHHAPARKPACGLSPMAIAHVADALANAGQDIKNAQYIIEGFDLEYLEQAHLLDHMDAWRQACADHLEN